MAVGLRLNEGLEFNVAAEAAARAPDPRESRLGRRCAACPGLVIYCPGAKGAETGNQRRFSDSDAPSAVCVTFSSL